MNKELLTILKDVPDEKKKELVRLASKTSNADEVLELAKKNGIEITKEQAETIITSFKDDSKISLDELDAVAGGNCGGMC